MCIVAWAVQWNGTALRHANKPLLALGDWSYALYLCHVPVIQAVVQLWPASFKGLDPSWFAVGASFLAVLVFGPLDIALYRKLRTLSDNARLRTTQIAMLAFVAAFLALATFGSVTHLAAAAQTGRIQSTLALLGPEARKDPNTAAARIAETQMGLPVGFRGAFERTDPLPDGDVVLRGWALSASDASEAMVFRIFCGNRQISIKRHQRKMRRDIAEALGREDAATHRFGFTLLTSQKACPKPAEAFIMVFDSAGKAAVLPGSHQF
jgi:hypothetical protein